MVVNSLQRRKQAPPDRPIFLVMSGLLCATLLSGIIWTAAGRTSIAGYSLITIHTVLAVLLATLMVSHILSMRFILRLPEARDRRAFLRLGAGALAGVALWNVGGLGKLVIGLPGASRRFTGSYETGSLTGDFPTVSWLADDPSRVSEAGWRLTVRGAVKKPLELTYRELAARPRAEDRQIVDCTGGWYSEQVWSGMKVGDLLAEAGVEGSAESVSFTSVTGFSRRFAVDEAGRFVLATSVAGEPLSHGHGFPLRLVAAGHRGFDWVKWVERIEVDSSSQFLQPPIPLQ